MTLRSGWRVAWTITPPGYRLGLLLALLAVGLGVVLLLVAPRYPPPLPGFQTISTKITRISRADP